ncbi:hypothetical protein IFM89_037147, partial [Coptis chinensis]
MQKRSFTDGLFGGKVVEAFSWYPFLRSNTAITLYSTVAAGGLVWKWMGWGRALLRVLKFLLELFISILFTPAIAMAPFANYFGPQYRKVWLNFVYADLEKAGPVFKKWGQWAATRRDLFPTDLCIELSKLQTIKAPEHRFDYTKETVEKAFWRNLLDIFEDFEEAPVGSGHVTQVHRATLRCHNPSKEEKPRVVAVKVRHPGVNELVMMDLSIVSFFAKILSWIIPTTTFKWSRFDETLHKFAVFMGSQVDLSRKAEVLSCFHHSLNGCFYLASPEPLYPLVHPDVLVETFEEGESLARLIQSDCSLNPSSKVRDNIVHDGSRLMCKMFLVVSNLKPSKLHVLYYCKHWHHRKAVLHGLVEMVAVPRVASTPTWTLANKFINMDMSPRNILFSTDKEKPRFVVLDVGMTSNISLAYAHNVVRIIRAAGRRDGHTAAEETLKLSKKQECPYPYAFIE